MDMSIGNRIKTIRESKKLTLKELAERAPGMSISRIGNYESGYRMPGLVEVAILAGALGESVSALIGETKPSVDYNVFMVPVLDCKACCGEGVNQLEHDTIIDHMRISTQWAYRNITFSNPDTGQRGTSDPYSNSNPYSNHYSNPYDTIRNADSVKKHSLSTRFGGFFFVTNSTFRTSHLIYSTYRV